MIRISCLGNGPLAMSASVLAFITALGAVPAAAQETPAPADQQETAEADSNEIVVTAQKREERLLDVPVTVNVVGANQLRTQNITSTGDLGRAVPSLGGAFLGGTPSIRGVATGGFARSSEEAVSTVVDGVVMGRTAISQLFDLDRVEVLSGPQGMLFGKNASAGVINIVTAAPKFNKFEVIGAGDVGNYDFTRARLTVNLPVASNLALRLSGFEAAQDTLVVNARTGKRNFGESVGGRGRLRWEPTSNLSINLSADYEKNRGNGNFSYVFAILPTEPVTLDTQLASCGITVSKTNTRNCGEGISSRTTDNERYGVSGQIDYTLPGDFTLTSITAMRWLTLGDFGTSPSSINRSLLPAGARFADFSLGGDSDGVPTDVLSRNLAASSYRNFSQELRLTSPSGQRVEFVAGLYYSSSNNHDEIFQAGGLGYLPAGLADARYQVIDIAQKSYAAFGQGTFHVTGKFSLIAGARFTHETLRDVAPVATPAALANILASQGLTYSNVGFSAGFTPVNARISDDNFSWRLGARYKLTPDVMVFATAARGYKGAAVSDQGARRDSSGNPVDPIVQPEIPMSYELGLKANLTNRMFLTATLFHSKIDNFQTQVFAPAIGVLPAGFVQGNAPWMKTKGIDVSLFGQPVKGLTVNVGAIYTDAEYSPDFLVACAPQLLTGSPGCSAARTTAAVDQVANTPKFRFLANAEYAQELGGNLTGFIQSDFQYQTKSYTSPTPDPILRAPDMFFLNGRIGLRDTSKRWGVSIWGKNLLGNQYNIYQPDFVSLAGNGRNSGLPGALPGYLVAPTTNWKTTYGLSVDFAF